MTERCLFSELHRLILLRDPAEKCTAVADLASSLDSFQTAPRTPAEIILTPGYPHQLQMVAPRHLKRRGIQSQAGRNCLMHAVAHIEFNAINLALDAAYRFRGQPTDYYHDWIMVASDEARHFRMIERYLKNNDCTYGDYPVHNGLWDMAVATQHDVVARMALVPRVLEARGLDVTPGMIVKLRRVDDQAAIKILQTIYEDEIGHVDIGSRWFFHQCQQQQLEPKSTFLTMIDQYLHGELRGPFNIGARLQAGFDEMELAQMNERSPHTGG